MIRLASLLLLLAVSTMQSPTPADAPPGRGISLTLAEERVRRISDLRYDLQLTIPEKVSDAITGRIAIAFLLKDASRPLALDFTPPGRVTAAVRGTTMPSLAVVGDHLVIPPSDLREGRNEIVLEFTAGDAALNRNAEFFYTLFVPARAHLTFPCFDQPDLKARWTVALTVPEGWRAIANAPLTEQSRGGGRVALKSAETPPLSTYVFAVAAGKFSSETAERRGRTFTMFHRETDAAKVARNRDAIFDLHAAALDWLERYTGLPYPWGKFDFLLVPSFQFGGMEHPGAIFYNAASLFLDTSATQNQRLGRASLIAHETAHMWFGDLVTMRWFDDVWMKEVFANFMAAKIVNPSFPEINHELRFLLAHYPAAYEIDRTPGTNAVRQRLDNLDEAGSLYGAIIYQKAPIVMRQLETMLGPDGFQAGVRQYLRAHAFGNATWPDLIAVLDERTPDDLAAWSHAWVEEAGRPILRTELQIEGGRIQRLALAQRDPIASRGLQWDQRLQVALGFPSTTHILAVRIDGITVDVAAARGLPAPAFVLPSAGGIGYAGFELDAGTVAYLLEHLPTIADPLTRGAAWVTLWDQMLERRASAAALADLALRALPLETDEQNVQRVLGYLEQAYWKFLPAAERLAMSPRLEQTLRGGLDRATTSSLKAAWFAALRDTAQSKETVAWLERVWRKTEMVPGLTLAEPDYITLALRLALLEVPGAESILDEQQARIENPDRRDRFVFVRPSVSADVNVRDVFFAQLGDAKMRQREPWVLEALTYLHHPLRAAAAEKHIARSLDLLREIQRTGDIFFPKRWMDATLSGHRSAPAALMVKRFLAELPAGYPDRLRRVILSASDDLFRASGIER
ncbi:MAG TPA: M1 family aminopeptidase [Vicinamibacterales bacterium]|nr:M1 family aminopeptidase [Vicinamibacterales bacterium]